MKNLIIGNGQIGSALYEIFRQHHKTFIRDIEDIDCGGIEVLHICYPDQDRFVEITKGYIQKYQPFVTIIHSSVAVGTTGQCGAHVVYSPVRGRHPKLVKDIMLYEKFVFSKDDADRLKAYTFLTRAGLKVRAFDTAPKAGEMLKLISNVHMGLEIAWRQQMARIFPQNDITDFIYREWEETYRRGYILSGDRDLVRPIMRADPIGGHCILPCTEILKKQYPSKIFEFIVESNKQRKGELNGMAQR